MTRERSSRFATAAESGAIVTLLAVGLLTIRWSLLPDPFAFFKLKDLVIFPGDDYVRRVAGQVRFRPSVSPLWRDVIDVQSGIRDDFQIFTGEAGIAELTLRESSMRLSPNTLLRIARTPRPIQPSTLRALVPDRVRLDRGRVAIHLDADTPALLAEASGKTYRLKLGGSGAGDLILATPPPTLEHSERGLTVEASVPFEVAMENPSGGLDASAKRVPVGAALSIGESDSASLSALRLPWQAEEFPDPARILARGGAAARKLPVELRWNPSPGVDARAWRAEVKVIVVGEGASQIEERPAADGRVRFELSPGNYGWRIEGTTRSGAIARTAWRGFSVVALRTPSLLSPAAGESYFTRGGAPIRIRFIWRELPADQTAEVELKSAGQSPSRQIVGEAGGAAAELAPRRYSWRARARTPDGELSGWSSEQEFSIADEASRNAMAALPAPVAPVSRPAPPAITPPVRAKPAPITASPPRPQPAKPAPAAPRLPLPRLPREGAVFAENSRLTLTWESLGEGSAYGVEIAEDSAFSRVIFQTEVTENFAFWQPPSPGTYHWRVRGAGRSGVTQWTPPRTFRIR